MSYKNNKTILAIESSCDETAAAIVGGDGEHLVEVKSSIIASQTKVHAKYGGIFPDLAAREHTKKIIPVIASALYEADLIDRPTATSKSIQKALSKIDAIAATIGPGLIGSLLVGTNAAATLALIAQKPAIPINHWEGHLYSVFIENTVEIRNSKSEIRNNIQNQNQQTEKTNEANKLMKLRAGELPKFPLLILTVSGGHTMLVLMKDHFKYQILGSTLDDAAGEVFDKTARMLGLGFPGGPILSQQAAVARKNQNKATITLPRPMIARGLNFSFSGLKTAVLYAIKRGDFKIERQRDMQAAAREIEGAIVEVLIAKLIRASEKYQVQSVAITGGVSANQYLREQAMSQLLKANSYKLKDLYLPDLSYTTDNAAMIGTAAIFHLRYNKGVGNYRDLIANASLRL